MRVYSHYCYTTLSNCYLVGPDGPGDAILVDPSCFDTSLLSLAERHGYVIRNVLFTHCDNSHTDGLRVLRKIYDCTVHAAVPMLLDLPAHRVDHGNRIGLDVGTVDVIGLPGYGRDSMAYLLNGFLFSGIALTAGETGSVPNTSALSVLVTHIKDRVMSLPDWTVILPFWGPPSTVGLERTTFQYAGAAPGEVGC